MPPLARVLVIASAFVAAFTLRAGIADLTYPSPLLKRDVPIKVYTPPGYEADAGTRYPTVYNLHGGGGSPERQWNRTRATLTDAMENKRVRPMIYVYVNGLGNTEFVNNAEGLQIERSIIEELIPFIDAKYRTIANKEARAIDGFSMGGFGCLSVAFRNPEQFIAVCSYGAALTITAKGRNYRDEAHFAEHDPWSVVRRNTDVIRDGVRVRMVCGDADYLYESNVKFKDLLGTLNIPVEWVSVPGVAHNTQGLYETVGLESLQFFAETFAFAAAKQQIAVASQRERPSTRLVAGTRIGDEPAPFRPSGPLPRIRVNSAGHYFETEDGKPFFYLADTAWLLFQNLDREEVDKYFEDRATKQFSVVLAHIAPWRQGEKNAYGETAWIDNDYAKPNEKYWAHCDHIVAQAAAKGVYIGILPLWTRNYINIGNRAQGPSLITAAQARAYGKWLGQRYGKKSHVQWVIGGDAAPLHEDIHDALAEGITEGAGGDPSKVLMTYHPKGTPESSATWFHDHAWLDFNMIQSSHWVWKLNYVEIAREFALQPHKPILEGEPCYENHPIAHGREPGHFNAWHVRTKAYWSVFAGGAGFVYGGNGIWQMDKPGLPHHRASHFTQYWFDALDLSGAKQMKHLRALIESRPFLSRVPDDGTVLSSPAGKEADRVQVTRGADRTWAMFYLTSGHNVTANLGSIKGPKLNAWWFNPRTGETCDASGKPSNAPFDQPEISRGRVEFNPPGEPGEDNDWVLVLDDAGANYARPGTR